MFKLHTQIGCTLSLKDLNFEKKKKAMVNAVNIGNVKPLPKYCVAVFQDFIECLLVH